MTPMEASKITDKETIKKINDLTKGNLKKLIKKELILKLVHRTY